MSEKGYYHPDFGYWQAVGDAEVENPEGTVEVPLKPGQGYEWDGEEWVEPTPPSPEETRASMPSLTARQLRIGLITNGFDTTDVENAIASVSDPVQRAVAQVEWEYASSYERNHPLISQVGAALQLSEEEIDAMWMQAVNL